MTVVETS